MIDQQTVYGVVVWYNPTATNVEAIRTYVDSVQKLFVVDNSEIDNSALLSGFDASKICYLPNMTNMGIATSLNIGCQQAVQAGAEWILTMDQDSRFDQASLSEFIAEANLYPNFEKVGIFSPYHYCGKNYRKEKKHERFQVPFITMTSGNLLRTEAYMKCGRFLEEFFIDLVDDEFCCRLYRNGYIVVRTTRIRLTHQLGNGFVRVCWPFKKHFIQHPALRHYYIVRNALQVIRLYPEQKKYYTKQLRKRLKRWLLYDWNDKYKKLKYMYWGWYDFRKQRFGKFNH